MKTVRVFLPTTPVLALGATLLFACGGAPDRTERTNQAASSVCSVPSDCSGLLPRNEEQCADGSFSGASWACVEGTCQVAYCAAPPSNGCSVASDCTGALPRNEEQCSDGSFSSASWACTDAVCQIQYCPPAPSSNGCNVPSDCSGALPRNEVQCADGSYSGASWGCASNQCTIQYCVGVSSPDAGSTGTGDAGVGENG